MAPNDHRRVQINRTKPILIALIGIGGAERRLFLEALSDTPPPYQYSNSSVPLTARVTKGMVDGKQVWLIDSPSTTASDTEMLEAFGTTLDHEPCQGQTTALDGVICLHDINETCTLEDTAGRNLAMVKTLLAPTLGANVMVVTTLWDRLTSADQGVSAEAKLTAVYSESFPAVVVNRVEDSRADNMENAHLRMVQDLVNRVASTQVIDQEKSLGSGPGNNNNTPAWAAQLQSFIHDRDQELAGHKAELGIIQDAFDAQSLELKKVVEHEQGLRNRLQQAEEQMQQQLKTQMEQQNAKHSNAISLLQERFDAEREDLSAKLRQSETDRADLTRQLDDLRQLPQRQQHRHRQRRDLNSRLNVLDERGEFLLYRAAAGGHYDDVKRLLEQGADACMRTGFRWTSLHWAASNGHTNVVQLLLSYGADVNAASDTGRKPLGMAKKDEIRSMLLQAGAT